MNLLIFQTGFRLIILLAMVQCRVAASYPLWLEECSPFKLDIRKHKCPEVTSQHWEFIHRRGTWIFDVTAGAGIWIVLCYILGTMANSNHKVFISHGKPDTWIALQLSKEIQSRGAATFLDETDIPKGANFKKIIRDEVSICDELIAIFTPWSAQRFWVWTEVGAAWGQGKLVVAILYGITIDELVKLGESRAIFEDINI